MTSKTLEARAAGQSAGSYENEQQVLIKQLLIQLAPRIDLVTLLQVKKYLENVSELDTQFLDHIIEQREDRFEGEMLE
ncbi:MAG: hypothetical protein ACOC85_03955 [Thermoplasmatota archaeon]